ncbi:MAG: hypothetical protein ATN36_04945 [Epulopiscium sp. Nele67-Bin005]|nr:MAG: hypothetical protein ATN36_04945 [Epulopiscium sp. Nele67-Bin005]
MTFKGNVIASVLCIGAILFLVPEQGLLGFTSALLLQSGFATTYHLYHALQSIELPVDIVGWMIKPALAITFGSMGMKYVHNNILMTAFSLRISTFIAIVILGIFYLGFLFAFKCVTKKDIEMFIH